MSSSSGCGLFLRIVLGIINFFFLLVGAALVVLTCLLKWGNIIKLDKNTGWEQIINLTVLDAVVITLICIGGVVIVLSLIGLIGVTCSNRCLLVFHEIVVVILFLAHLAALIVLLVSWPAIEKEFKKGLNSTISEFNSGDLFSVSSIQKCNLMFNLSSQFDCCGISSPNDFSQTVQNKCCKLPLSSKGCFNMGIDKLKEYSIYFLIIPTSVILFIELVSIILVPFLIVSITRHK